MLVIGVVVLGGGVGAWLVVRGEGARVAGVRVEFPRAGSRASDGAVPHSRGRCGCVVIPAGEGERGTRRGVLAGRGSRRGLPPHVGGGGEDAGAHVPRGGSPVGILQERVVRRGLPQGQLLEGLVRRHLVERVEHGDLQRRVGVAGGVEGDEVACLEVVAHGRLVGKVGARGAVLARVVGEAHGGGLIAVVRGDVLVLQGEVRRFLDGATLAGHGGRLTVGSARGLRGLGGVWGGHYRKGEEGRGR